MARLLRHGPVPAAAAADLTPLSPRFSFAAAVLTSALLVAGCLNSLPRDVGDAPPGSRVPDASHYLRWVAFTPPAHHGTVMRWRAEQMPLRVHLPAPPPEMFDDPEEVLATVQRGVVGWTDVAAPGVPSFTFVDERSQADIPVVWASGSEGWWVAFAAYDLTADSRIFRVNRILVAARYPDGSPAQMGDLYLTMLHEVGHALGLLGHSPEPGDVMYEKGSWQSTGLTLRDRNTLRLLYAKPVGARIPGAKRNW